MLPSQSDLRPCPHCGGQVRYEPDPRFLWVCGACGGPVIPGMTNARGPAIEPLANAKALKAAAFVRRMGAIASATLGLVPMLLVPVFWFLFHSVATPLAFAMMMMAMFVASYALWKGADARSRASLQAVELGWLAYLADAIRHNGSALSAEEVARAGEIPVARAGELLESLARRGDVEMNISHEGRLTYGTLDAKPRIAVDEEFAELEAEQEAEASQKRAVKS